jgi:hypothetical protein
MDKLFDGVFQSEVKIEGDEVVRLLTQPSADIILERNNELRKNKGALRDMSFGRQVASIPLNEFEMLKRKYPDLVDGDAQQRQMRLMKILNSSEGRKYLVQDSV